LLTIALTPQALCDRAERLAEEPLLPWTRSALGLALAIGGGEGAPPAAAADAALLERARAGDARAFRALYFRYAPLVRRFAGTLCRDAGFADEATQETFARAWERLHVLREAARLRGWLLGIARLVVLDELKRQRREVAAAVPVAPEERSGAPTPEVAVLSAEADRALEAALARLAPDRRAALLMRLDLGLGYEEIGEAMGWPLHKVKNEIHRARLHIRDEVLGYLEAAR
jgi:RNA polymerase sigma-70 factor (ECF subfamily)